MTTNRSDPGPLTRAEHEALAKELVPFREEMLRLYDRLSASEHYKQPYPLKRRALTLWRKLGELISELDQDYCYSADGAPSRPWWPYYPNMDRGAPTDSAKQP